MKKTMVMLATLSIILSFFILQPEIKSVEWQDDYVLIDSDDKSAHSVFDSRFVVLPNGTVMCVWNFNFEAGDSGNKEIHRHVSTNGGQTWNYQGAWIYDDAFPGDGDCVMCCYFAWNGTRLWNTAISKSGSAVSNAFVRYADSDYLNNASWSSWIEIHDGTDNNATVGKMFSANYVIPFVNNGITTTSGRVVFPGFEIVGAGQDPIVLYHTGSGENHDDWHVVRITDDSTERSECAIVETTNGSIMAHIRSDIGTDDSQWRAWSEDEGETWSTLYELPEEQCGEVESNFQIIRFTKKSDGYTKNRILHVFNNYTANGDQFARYKLSISVSYDEGMNWNKSRCADECSGFTIQCSYPDIVALDNNTLLVTYTREEGGTAWDEIVIQRMNLDWITNSEDEIDTRPRWESINTRGNNSFTKDNNRAFNWTLVSGATQYNLVIANDSEFTDIFYNEELTDSDYTEKGRYVEYSLTGADAIKFNGHHFYRVRSFV